MYTYYKEKYKALVVASKESGLEVNADRTKYTVMSRDQRLIIVSLRGLKSSNVGNNLNKSKFYSGRN
jgi:hypothetical protein